jgi:glycosyltransferase involved in cell wall biosynthesis
MDYSDTTVVIPAKDEPALAPIIRKILKALPSCRIIVVYLGTVGKLSNRNVVFIRQRSRGYGAAIREGYSAAKTGIVANIDADGTYEPMDLRKVIALVRKGADMAIGNRLAGAGKRAMDSYLLLGNTLATLTFNIMFMKRIGDSQSGLWAMRRDIIRDLHFNETGMIFRTELNAEVANHGYRFAKVPIKYYERIGASKFNNKFYYGFYIFAKTIMFRFKS